MSPNPLSDEARGLFPATINAIIDRLLGMPLVTMLKVFVFHRVSSLVLRSEVSVCAMILLT